MKASHPECRAYGHHWRPVDVTADRHYYYQSMSCSQCGTKREDQINRKSCRTTKRRYSYEPGYRVKGGKARLEIRRELIEKEAHRWAL